MSASDRLGQYAFLLAASITSSAAVSAATLPIGDALDRPSVVTRLAEHSVLLAAAQAGPRLLAVGERGIVIFSDDNGKSWSQVPAPVSVTLTAMKFSNPSNGFAVGHGGVVLGSADGGKTWTRLTDGRRLAQLEVETARASGSAAALKAAERLLAEGPDRPLLDVLVFDARRLMVVGAYGSLFESRDGGSTWASLRSRIENPKELHLNTARRRGDSILIAGEQGAAFLSRDGGSTFSRLTIPYKGSFFTAELPPDGSIVLAGLRGNVWRSADDGRSWTQVEMPAHAAITGSTQAADGRIILVNQAGMVIDLLGSAGRIRPMPALPPLNGIVGTADGASLVLSIQGVARVGSASASETSR